MPLQVHRVMEDAKHFDDVAFLPGGDTKHDEVAPLAAAAGNMKREQPLGNLGSSSGA